MPLVLMKRKDGAAFISVTEQMGPDEHREGGAKLAPDDIVDGKPVCDWPAGVFTVSSLRRYDGGQNDDA